MRRNPALERLDALVGKWTMEATPPGGPPWPGEARVTFEWLEGQTFLIERWTVDLPEAPDGIAIIGAGDEPETFRQHYFDTRGVHRIYEMTMGDGVWKLWRDAPDPFPQRFSGTFDDDGKTIAGRWEKAEDGVRSSTLLLPGAGASEFGIPSAGVGDHEWFATTPM